ncbi:MAG: hypothetical protein H8E21_05385 [Gammaproteobacteria bacterium]|nr:hypothetical protein [Gammaproteobacteria bacterium]
MIRIAHLSSWPACAETKVSALLLRLSLIGLVILIQSCASAPQQRPKAWIDAEQYLQQGTQAYHDDEYAQAADSFSQALKTYLSIDHYPGMIDSYSNLIETTIAIGNYALAHQQLEKIEQLMSDNHDSNRQTRVRLLKVKLMFNQADYAQALTTLQPLLPEFNAQQQLQNRNSNSLNIISSMARLSVTTGRDDADLWLQRFQQALQPDQPASARYQALLLRLQAQRLQQQNKFADSASRLEQALSLYHQQAYRRGIAATLQQLADLETRQQHWELADHYLQRALQIHLWTLNQHESIQILEQLVGINQQLGNLQSAENFALQLSKLKSGDAAAR